MELYLFIAKNVVILLVSLTVFGLFLWGLLWVSGCTIRKVVKFFSEITHMKCPKCKQRSFAFRYECHLSAGSPEIWSCERCGYTEEK